MRTAQSDPPIDEVREVRHSISARFENDPSRLVAHYMELQLKYRDRLIDAHTTPAIAKKSAA